MNTTGQQFAAVVRKSFRMNSRTLDRRDGGSIKAAIIESIAVSNEYPGYYGPERTALSSAAFGSYLAYRKHVDGYRIDGVLRYRITTMSPWNFAALIGNMIDAGVTNCGQGEDFFRNMAREQVAA